VQVSVAIAVEKKSQPSDKGSGLGLESKGEYKSEPY
jgi:hypothetical protein